MEWKLEVEEFKFAGCMHNHTSGVEVTTAKVETSN
jgi:hypothetical protein